MDKENNNIRSELEMSRSGYSDDCEHIHLWRGNVERTINGKRGQEFLQELIEALEAMPDKRLITDSLRVETGEVCALGAVGLKRGIDMTRLNPEEPEQVGRAFGISTMLVQEIVYQNDERAYRRQTAEERWQDMHAWAKNHITSSESKITQTERE
jgi:hypothetical protein